MRSIRTFWTIGAVALVYGAGAAVVAAPVARMEAGHAAFLQANCGKCHAGEDTDSGVRLDDLPLEITTTEGADRWQKVMNVLNSGEMPPEEQPQPEREAKTEFLADLAQTLVVARKVIGEQGTRQIIRRLNKREYKNTVRDLLGVEIDVTELPQDGGAGAMDTVGAGLAMSSDQFESYLTLGRKAVEEAIAAQKGAAAKPQPYHRDSEDYVNERQQKIMKQQEEANAKYVAWTQAIDELAKLPEYADVVADITQRMGRRGDFKSQYYREWDRLVGKPDVKQYGYNDAGSLDFFARNSALKVLPTLQDYYQRPATDSGVYLGCHMVHHTESHKIPDRWPPGEYVYRYRIAATDDAEWHQRFVQFGIKGGGLDNFDLMSTHEVTGTLENPQILEVKVRVGSGPNRIFSIREKRRIKRGTDNDRFEKSFRKIGRGPTPVIWVDWVEIEGPLPPEPGTPEPVSLIAATQDAAGARDVIKRLATRAFRGEPPKPDYIDRLVNLFEARMTTGDSFEDAIERSLSVVLASPPFLYLAEPGEAGKPRPLSGVELANRLSYFLWSGPPDEELLGYATRGELSKPDVLAAQVDRLIASDRFDAFLAGFLHQWLDMERLDFFEFDAEKHRDFDDSMKVAARWEVYETFAHVLRTGGSLRQLLSSDEVIVNGLLARYYGLEGVSGDEFRTVSLPAGSPRGGLLGMAAIHAMGSDGTASHPIHRGVWVAKHLLNDPPPPAPPNVPQLSRLEGQLLTTRERFVAHQEEPQCASCHRRFDPIGFGLENFDAAGLWRTTDAYEKKGVGKREWEIEPAGKLHGGPAFKDYFELREIVAERVDAFARSLTEAIVEYGLGRPCGYADEELAATILARAKAKDWQLREFIQALAASRELQSK
ncbi:MAG: DUF1592 domain-containing protein [Pirellulales bacterium]